VSESDFCYLAVLTILNVSTEDAGEYMFFVKNTKGIHEGTIFLNITQASFSVSTSRAYPLRASHFPLLSSLINWSLLSMTAFKFQIPQLFTSNLLQSPLPMGALILLTLGHHLSPLTTIVSLTLVVVVT
ncbi:unnamed protein product, partial [Allacma fusca]